MNAFIISAKRQIIKISVFEEKENNFPRFNKELLFINRILMNDETIFLFDKALFLK